MRLLLFMLFLFAVNSGADDYTRNIFETKDYIVLLRFSTIYSSHKLSVEKVIESSKKLYINPRELEDIKKLNDESFNFLSQLYENYDCADIRSQISQIKIEIRHLNSFIDSILSSYRKTLKYSYQDVVNLEKYIYRMEIYFRGLSNRISNL